MRRARGLGDGWAAAVLIDRLLHHCHIVNIRDRCLRLIRALAVEQHEDWLEGSRYLNMDFLAEQKRQRLREAT